jgi:hypothetical protein
MRKLLVALIFFIITTVGVSQQYFTIECSIINDSMYFVDDVRISLYENEQKIFRTGDNYIICDLDYNKFYKLVVSKQDYITKIVEFDTNTEDVSKGIYFEMAVIINYKKNEYPFNEMLIGRIFLDPTGKVKFINNE